MTHYLPMTLHLRLKKGHYALKKQQTDTGMQFNALFQWFKTKWAYFLLNEIAPFKCQYRKENFFLKGAGTYGFWHYAIIPINM